MVTSNINAALNILAIDTSGDYCSLALQYQNRIWQKHIAAPKQQSEIILSLLKELLNEANCKIADLNLIAFGAGPASFTGTRLAASIVQGLALPLHLKVLPIATFSALAAQAFRLYQAKRVIIAEDARMQEMYFAAYAIDKHGLATTVIPDILTKPDELTLPPEFANHECYALGSAWEIYGTILRQKCAQAGIKIVREIVSMPVCAEDLITLAKSGWQKGLAKGARYALPIYL